MRIFAVNVIVFLSIIDIIYSTIVLHSFKKYFLLKRIFFSSYASWDMLELFWYSLQDRMGLFNRLFLCPSALYDGGGMIVSVQKWMVTVTTSKPISHTEFPLNKKIYFDHRDTYVCVYLYAYISAYN